MKGGRQTAEGGGEIRYRTLRPGVRRIAPTEFAAGEELWIVGLWPEGTAVRARRRALYSGK